MAEQAAKCCMLFSTPTSISVFPSSSWTAAFSQGCFKASSAEGRASGFLLQNREDTVLEWHR